MSKQILYNDMVTISGDCVGKSVAPNRSHDCSNDWPFNALVNSLGAVISQYVVDGKEYIDAEFFSEDFNGMLRGTPSDKFVVEP